MRVELLTIGDELLIGQVLNSNAAWIGEQMNLLGADLLRTVVVGDNLEDIRRELTYSFQSADLVVITGGLGPTHDDVTREALARFFGVDLHLDRSVFEQIRRRFEKKGRQMPESNRTQAMVPDTFQVLPNPVGTAPGLWWEGEQNGGYKLLTVLPGVPHEMKYLLQHEVLPRLRAHKGLKVILHRTILTTGIGESQLQERIGDLSDFLSPDLRLAYLPTSSGVRLRLTAHGHGLETVKQSLDTLEKHLRNRIGSYIFGTNEDTLEGVVGALLRERGLSLAVAESCTGGHVLDRLTNVSGASTYILGGIIAYSNQVKIELLGVDPVILERDGAVSEVVAQQMAQGVRTRLGADIGVSITGIAGPTGGTPEKPVGTIWFGLADQKDTKTVLMNLADDRILNKELAGTAILNIIRRFLTGTGESP